MPANHVDGCWRLQWGVVCNGLRYTRHNEPKPCTQRKYNADIERAAEMRLDKFIAKSTDLTLRQACEAVQAGKVTVNAELATQGNMQVHERNDILLAGQVLTLRPFNYLMLNKPAGMVCSNIDEFYPSLFNLLPWPNTDLLHVVGRLDADTTGLVLITDDGRWSFQITSPSSKCAKVYLVDVAKPISAEQSIELTSKFSAGLQLQGESAITQPAKFELISSKKVRLTITEGRFHQVKRMFACVGNKVRALHREQIGGVALDVAPSKWRSLTNAEIAVLGRSEN